MEYTYWCSNPDCKHTEKFDESMKADAQTTCPACKKETFGRIVYGGSGMPKLKGVGFHCNDYDTTPEVKPRCTKMTTGPGRRI